MVKKAPINIAILPLKLIVTSDICNHKLIAKIVTIISANDAVVINNKIFFMSKYILLNTE